MRRNPNLKSDLNGMHNREQKALAPYSMKRVFDGDDNSLLILILAMLICEPAISYTRSFDFTNSHTPPVPPLGVFMILGCGSDLIINIILTTMGFLPGHLHGFWVIYREYKREESARYRVREATAAMAPLDEADPETAPLPEMAFVNVDKETQTMGNASSDPAFHYRNQ